MKIIPTISFLSASLIIYGNSLPVEKSTILSSEYKQLFDEQDGFSFNNLEYFSLIKKDENYTELLYLQNYQPFVLSDHVSLYLFVKNRPDSAYLLNLENSKHAPINICLPTKILIHGWRTDGINNSFIIGMKDAFFQAGGYNVIIVDYQKYANLSYPISIVKARMVGDYVGQVIVSLHQQSKLRFEDVHAIGHSLGAHVCGFVGKTVNALSGKKIGRITGLDPAGPLFETPVLLGSEKRLHKDDALFTDIIHTGGGSLGFRTHLGHADFFPNSGLPIQPGCGNEKLPFGCSHVMSCILYNESISSDQFLATPCSSWKTFKQGKCDESERVSMGHHLDVTKARGNYYLYTNEISPHALG